jgi:hypothetical protein
MPAKYTSTSKLLVIDTSIVSSASGKVTDAPRPNVCRELLNQVFEICHRVAMTAEIWDDWQAHRSGFAEQWYFRMKRKNKVVWIETQPNINLRNKLKQFIENETAYEAVDKDFILIQAAQAADQIILSLDETTRIPLVSVAQNIGEIRILYWLNPETAEDYCIAWLQDGCPANKKYQMGYVGEEY